MFNGRGGGDTLDGRGGNDVLVGGAGSNTLFGGAGDDILNGGGALELTTVLEDPAAFESTNYGFFPSINGWTNPGGERGVLALSAVNSIRGPHSGTYFIDLDDNRQTSSNANVDRLEKTFATVAGRVYQLSFAMASAFNNQIHSGHPNFTPFDDISQTVFVYVNGVNLRPEGFIADDQGNYVVHTVEFIGTGSDLISFREAPEGNDAWGPLLDSIGLRATGQADVLTGGAGADRFVLERSGVADIITGFEVGIDTLGLLDFKVSPLAIAFVAPLVPPGDPVPSMRQLYVDTLHVADIHFTGGPAPSLADILLPVNAVDDTGLAVDGAGTTVLPDLFANDTAGLGATLTITEINERPVEVGDVLALPGGGTLTIGAGGVLIFDAQDDFRTLAPGTGVAQSFSYTASDGTTSDTATVDFTVNAAPHILGTAAGETLDGTGIDEVLFGGAGNDILNGGGGDDTLSGGPGNDQIDGGDGIDTLSFAGAGARAVLFLGGGAMAGSAAGDSYANIENVVGSSFDDIIYGDAGANTIWGGTGRDVLTGFGGDDALFGGLGGDILSGGVGSDRLTGGSGRDVFRVLANDGTDTVTDWSEADDFFLFRGIAGVGACGDLTFTDTGADVEITAATDPSFRIIVQGVELTDLDEAANFLFQ